MDFVKRWYQHVYRISLPYMDRAIDLLALYPPSAAAVQPKIPQVGDIILWKPTPMYPSGHAAIIIKVFQHDSAVMVAEQGTAAQNGIRMVDTSDGVAILVNVCDLITYNIGQRISLRNSAVHSR